MMPMSDMMNMMGPPMGLLMILFGLLVLGLAIVGAVLIVRALTKRRNGAPESKDDALEVARARFARGEIDRQSFDEIKEALAEH